jgi:N6-L-threonylcarbamoyladenine synthase
VLVSGGHTVICRVDDYDTIEVLGTTIDDAIGEAFDKVAKHYGFGYPGGVAIDQLAKRGNPLAFLFPGSTLHAKDHPYDISYSGLKTAAINQLDSFWDGVSDKSPENIAASFQRSAVNMLTKRVRLALQETGLRRLSVGGGVAANSYLRSELLGLREGGYEVAFPSLKLCTDNGAMIAALAYHYLRDGITSDFTESASARVTAFKKQYP